MMEPTFEKLLALLADGNVAFVLVGGVAVTLHGYVRLTEDVDILIEASGGPGRRGVVQKSEVARAGQPVGAAFRLGQLRNLG